MPNFILYIPLATTVLSAIFTVVLYRHWRSKPKALYIFWWALGLFLYGAGTFTESYISLFGWNEVVFKAWYIFGALLGGAPLAQGTAYLILGSKTANTLAIILTSLVIVASVCVIMSPVNYALVDHFKPGGKVLEWKWVRYFSPFINTYACIFLIGGAIWSAWKYRVSKTSSSRFWGNVLIAIGAILPGIGGTFTRMGYTEVLYVTELMGLILIWWGYNIIRKDSSSSIHQHHISALSPA